MSSYPSRVVLGATPTQRVYVLQHDRLVLRFDTDDANRIEETLARLQLQVDRPRKGGASPSLSADSRVVRLPMGRLESIADLTRRLLSLTGLPAGILMATPVYQMDGAGLETGVSPVPGRLLLRFGRQTADDERSAIADRYKLTRERDASAAIAPFELLTTPLSVTPNDRPRTGASKGDVGHGLPMLGEPSALFEIQRALSGEKSVDQLELDWLWLYGLQLIPSDTHWANQWSMTTVGMPAAWDVQTGGGAVVIAVIDSGVDLTHPDLVLTAPSTHFHAQQAEGGPGPYNAAPDPADINGAHGTLVSGIAAASLNNTTGVAGVAGGCPVMPLRVFPNATNARLAACINWAVSNGAEVINMSLAGPSSAVVTTAVVNAWSAGLVLCAASANYYSTVDPASAPVMFPASHPNCIAIGASDQNDQRKRATSADGEEWGSHWGAELDVVAPGVRLWSTDPRGATGWNDNAGGPITWQGVTYANSGDAAGDYFALMGGTSGATPHVAGLAALLLLRYPALTNQRVRDIIERTCSKVSSGLFPYAPSLAHPNGSWHEQMGYGRINAHAALTYADLIVRDHPFDTGSVPSSDYSGGGWTPAPFWTYQPFVTNATNPTALPSDHQPAMAGQDNYVHAVVRNDGPADATNILVTWHIMDYPGTELVYPADWNAANMIASTTIASLPAGTEMPVQALWPQAAVDVAAGYVHPCMVVAATTPTDVGGQAGQYVYQYNNLAQHNISFAPMQQFGVRREFMMPFAVGHRTSMVRHATVRFDLRALNGATAYLDLAPDPDNVFVSRILDDARAVAVGKRGRKGCRITATEDTALRVDDGRAHGTLVLRAGSSFTLAGVSGAATIDTTFVRIISGALTSFAGREVIALRGNDAAVEIPLDVGAVVPLAIVIAPPGDAKSGERFRVDVTQFSEGVATGGISLEVQR